MTQDASVEGPTRNEGKPSMTSAVDDEATHVYELSCTTCAFGMAVEGTLSDALAVADSHQKEHGDADGEHFVDFERKNE